MKKYNNKNIYLLMKYNIKNIFYLNFKLNLIKYI